MPQMIILSLVSKLLWLDLRPRNEPEELEDRESFICKVCEEKLIENVKLSFCFVVFFLFVDSEYETDKQVLRAETNTHTRTHTHTHTHTHPHTHTQAYMPL